MGNEAFPPSRDEAPKRMVKHEGKMIEIWDTNNLQGYLAMRRGGDGEHYMYQALENNGVGGVLDGFLLEESELAEETRLFVDEFNALKDAIYQSPDNNKLLQMYHEWRIDHVENGYSMVLMSQVYEHLRPTAFEAGLRPIDLCI